MRDRIWRRGALIRLYNPAVLHTPTRTRTPRWAAAALLALWCLCPAMLLGGCAAIDAPVLTSVFDEDPATWKHLPRSQRYLRGWNHFEKGVSYAKSAAIRSDHRLVAHGAERATEGLQVCEAAAEPGAWRDGLAELRAAFQSFGNYARNGRLYRPRRRLDDLSKRAEPYHPSIVDFPATDHGGTGAGATQPRTGIDEQPTPAAGDPTTEIPEGTVFRKRTEISAGPNGEVTTYLLVVLKRGGAMVDAIVPKELWDRSVLGEPVPKPAADDSGDDGEGGK